MARARSSRRSSAKDSTAYAVELLNGLTTVPRPRHDRDDTDDENQESQHENPAEPVESPPRGTESSPVSPPRSRQRATLPRPSRRPGTRSVREPRSEGMFEVPDTPTVRRSARLSLPSRVSPRRRSLRIRQHRASSTELGQADYHGGGEDLAEDMAVEVAEDTAMDASEDEAGSEDQGGGEDPHGEEDLATEAEDTTMDASEDGAESDDDLPDPQTLLRSGEQQDSDSAYEEDEMEDAASSTDGDGARPAEKRPAVLDRVEIVQVTPRRRGRPRRQASSVREKVAAVARGEVGENDVERPPEEEEEQQLFAEACALVGPKDQWERVM
ncbi:hypothetical protein VTN02DRAFT_6459 [Thermoascus thermophilus]